MDNKKAILNQTKIAFEFLQKLYHEASYLIKEIEGILSLEEEEFKIARPSGYSISARSSTGLESNNVNLWLLRKFSVAFIEHGMTKTVKGQTVSEVNNKLKLLYFKVILDDKDIHEPVIYSSVFYNFKKKPSAKRITKFENTLAHFEYNDKKMFKNVGKNEYDDSYINFKYKYISTNLYDINDSEDILNKILKPTLEIYRNC